MSARKTINGAICALGVIFILYYLGMGLAVRFGQSLLWLWPVMGAVCLLRWYLVRMSIKTGKPVPVPKWFIILWRTGLCCGMALILLVQGFIIYAASDKAPENLSYVIVLGAKVNGTQPSGALSQRINAAAEYLAANSETLCIASGGQGDDEGISEAVCIRNGLVQLGIDESRIILEDESVSTETNFINSFELIENETEAIGVVTNDFHMFRALWNGRQLGSHPLYSISAASTAWGYVHYSLREFCAVAVGIVTGDLQIGA